MGGGVRAEEGWACRGELRAGGPRDATDWRRAAGEVEEAVSGKRRADPARDAETGAEGEADYEIPAERLPPGFVDTLEAPPKRPAVAEAAATVVVMREGDDGPEVLLLRRNRATGFVPGAYVFPGGRVDRADGDEKLARRWDSLTAAGATARLGLAADADPPAPSGPTHAPEPPPGRRRPDPGRPTAARGQRRAAPVGRSGPAPDRARPTNRSGRAGGAPVLPAAPDPAPLGGWSQGERGTRHPGGGPGDDDAVL